MPASLPMTSGRVYAEVAGAVNTGIAIANPSPQETQVSYYFTDASGKDFGNGSFVLPASHQIAAFLNQAPFNLTGTINGTLTLTSAVPVGIIALRGFTNERGEFLMTTLPVSPVDYVGGSFAVLPHFADGGGWATEVVLTNLSDSPQSGTIQFFSQGLGSQAGSALTMALSDGTSNSTFSYSVAPHGAVQFSTAGTGTTIQDGSVRVTPVEGSRASRCTRDLFIQK